MFTYIGTVLMKGPVEAFLMEVGFEDIGIYNMEDGRIEPLYQGNLDHCFVPLMWIEHSS